MTRFYKFITILIYLFFTKVEAQSSTNKTDYFTNQWEVTDALGRTLPTYEEAGNLKKDKIVGVFYYVWQGFHGKEIRDITKISKQPKQDQKWEKPGEVHFWGEPEQGNGLSGMENR